MKRIARFFCRLLRHPLEVELEALPGHRWCSVCGRLVDKDGKEVPQA